MGQRGQLTCRITSHSESGSEASRRRRSLDLAPPAPCLSLGVKGKTGHRRFHRHFAHNEGLVFKQP
jgi:hypothetical protein